jgi:hypothetical protein
MNLEALPRLTVRGDRFVDTHGRHVMLRGVNLGGDCKVPFPHGGTHVPTDFADHRTVSFIGRPFPLAEADIHFRRLRHWGFNSLRLLTTWEAVEHAGPGLYDEAYLDYYAQICERAGAHGLYVLVDFHQDVFSRMTGGDGAPGWVFEAVGLDFTRFPAADAAHVMQAAYDYADPRPRQPERYAQMSWANNYNMPINGVMWTLFFGGARFTPDFQIDGRNVQDYLQGHFFGAQRALAERVAHLPHVIGFDILNEPSSGWIGRPLSRPHLKKTVEEPRTVLPGPVWTPFDALAALRGMPRDVPNMEISLRRLGIVQKGTRRVNPNGVRVWLPEREDPFEVAGAYRWEAGQPVPLREDFFQRQAGQAVDFANDHLAPFYERAATNLRSVRPDWLVFAEPDLLAGNPQHSFPRELPVGTVNAGHCYEVTTLVLKRVLEPVGVNLMHGRVLFGPGQIEADYRRELAQVQGCSQRVNGGCPTLIGEFGIPFDLREGRAYRAFAAGDHGPRPWRAHERALGRMYNALDQLLLSAMLWNYTASNRNHLAVGDGWNQEDLSIFSEDQRLDGEDLDSGGRALGGFVRPYARFIQGTLRWMHFDQRKRGFELGFEADPSLSAPTEIFIPRRQFPNGYRLDAPGLVAMDQAVADAQSLRLLAHEKRLFTVRVQG